MIYKDPSASAERWMRLSDYEKWRTVVNLHNAVHGVAAMNVDWDVIEEAMDEAIVDRKYVMSDD